MRKFFQKLFRPRGGTKIYTNWKKGDKVEAFGTPGVVKSISSNGMFVEVQFEGAIGTMIFNIDGRLIKWAKEPSLRLVTE